MTASITTQFSAHMAKEMAAQAMAYEERFQTLEGHRVVTSKPKVTTERAL